MGPDGASTSGPGAQPVEPQAEDRRLQPLVRGMCTEGCGCGDPRTHLPCLGAAALVGASEGPVSLAGALSPPIKQ